MSSMEGNFSENTKDSFMRDREALIDSMAAADLSVIACEQMEVASITEDRIAMFREAHALGYALQLYSVMEKSGFTGRYLGFLSTEGATRMLGAEKDD